MFGRNRPGGAATSCTHQAVSGTEVAFAIELSFPVMLLTLAACLQHARPSDSRGRHDTTHGRRSRAVTATNAAATWRGLSDTDT